MNKYYLRFNPNSIRQPTSNVTWMVLEIADETIIRHYAKEVLIEVDSFTERSMEDKNWWNVACYGFLIREDHRIRIVKSL
jgi:hypothetical protein